MNGRRILSNLESMLYLRFVVIYIVGPIVFHLEDNKSIEIFLSSPFGGKISQHLLFFYESNLFTHFIQSVLKYEFTT